MDKIEKIGFTALLSALFAWLGVVAVPFLLLVLLQVIDYGTGLAAAKYRSEKISSYKSFRGIVRKTCMWLLVVVGGVMDWLVTYAANNIGIQLKVSFVRNRSLRLAYVQRDNQCSGKYDRHRRKATTVYDEACEAYPGRY